MSDKVNLFGRTHSAVGDTSSDLILRTLGKIKIQWANKFIDLLKDGKINVDSDFIFEVNDINEAIKDGFYVIGGLVYIKIGDKDPINIVGEVGNTYVSFLEKQETSSELKHQALENIGFIYKDISDIKEDSLKNGIIYIESELKLYIVNEGELTEYTFKFPNPFTELFIISKNDDKIGSLVIRGSGKLNSLAFDNMWIYNEDGNSYIDSDGTIYIRVGDKDIIIVEDDKTTFKGKVVSNYFQSPNATSDSGFRLYYKDGLSTLEVDNLIVRNGLDANNTIPYNTWWFSKLNVIKSIEEVVGEEVVEEYAIELAYDNEYIKDDCLYVVTSLNGKLYTVPLIVTSVEEEEIDEENEEAIKKIRVIIDNELFSYEIINSLRGKITFLITSEDLLKISPEGLDLLSSNDIQQRFGKLTELKLKEVNEGKDIDIKGNGVYSKLGYFEKAAYINSYNLIEDDNSSKLASTEWVKKVLLNSKYFTKEVLERIYVVNTINEMYKLTTNEVLNGDVVKVISDYALYFVKDHNKLSSKDGYEEFKVGTAANAAVADKVRNKLYVSINNIPKYEYDGSTEVHMDISAEDIGVSGDYATLEDLDTKVDKVTEFPRSVDTSPYHDDFITNSYFTPNSVNLQIGQTYPTTTTPNALEACSNTFGASANEIVSIKSSGTVYLLITDGSWDDSGTRNVLVEAILQDGDIFNIVKTSLTYCLYPAYNVISFNISKYVEILNRYGDQLTYNNGNLNLRNTNSDSTLSTISLGNIANNMDVYTSAISRTKTLRLRLDNTVLSSIPLSDEVNYIIEQYLRDNDISGGGGNSEGTGEYDDTELRRIIGELLTLVEDNTSSISNLKTTKSDKYTTLKGYGIADTDLSNTYIKIAGNAIAITSEYKPTGTSLVNGKAIADAIKNLAEKSSTLKGYGITDAKISENTITLGTNNILVVTLDKFNTEITNINNKINNSSGSSYDDTEIRNLISNESTERNVKDNDLQNQINDIKNQLKDNGGETYPNISGESEIFIRESLTVMCQRNATIYLPVDPEYIGKRVTIIVCAHKYDAGSGNVLQRFYNPNVKIKAGRSYYKHTYENISSLSKEIVTDQVKGPFYGTHWFLSPLVVNNSSTSYYDYFPNILKIGDGIIELVGVPSDTTATITEIKYKIKDDGTLDYGNTGSPLDDGLDSKYTGDRVNLTLWSIVNYILPNSDGKLSDILDYLTINMD